jgi:phosphoribosylglycinamide formyltransferase-1
VQGLDPTKTINIHPGPLYPGTEHHFGGKRMYGHHVHEAVIQAFREGKLTHSEITMHFVNDRYDEGSVFFRYPVSIFPDDTAETLGQRVNQAEHKRQPKMTDLVVQGEIALQSNGSLKLPQ